MKALKNYMWEIHTSNVEFTPNGKHPLKYNDVEDIETYAKIIWKKEMEYLEEYIKNMNLLKEELWMKIQIVYLEEGRSCFRPDPDNIIQHTRLNLLSEHLEQIKRDTPDLCHLIHQFVNHQYMSLSRVCNCILQENSIFYCPFRWEGTASQLIEICAYPFFNGQVVALTKHANIYSWVETIFRMLKQPLPLYLRQSIYKLLLRNDPCKYLHTLEKSILKK